MQKIKNKGTKKFAKFPLDFAVRRVVGFVVRRRFGAAAVLFLKVVLRVRVAIIKFQISNFRFQILFSNLEFGIWNPEFNPVSASPQSHRKAA